METDENKRNEEPKLCVVRRLEGLIESASWVKAKRKSSLLVVGLLVAVRSPVVFSKSRVSKPLKSGLISK